MTTTHVSFVLLPQRAGIDGAQVSQSHRNLFSAAALCETKDKETIELRSGGDVISLASMMPGPVPHGEAEDFAAYSYGTIIGAPTVGPHLAHVIVVSTAPRLSKIDALSSHLRHTASVADALGAVGVYDGNAGATHLAPLYIDAIRNDELPSVLVTGVSLAKDSDTKVSALTKGLQRLDLCEFLVTIPISSLEADIGYLFDLVEYVVKRRNQLGDGETIGRTQEERIRVKYCPSPVDPTLQVATLDLSQLHAV